MKHARMFAAAVLTWLAIGGVGYGVWSLSRAAWDGMSRTPAILSGCYVNGIEVSCDELLAPEPKDDRSGA